MVHLETCLSLPNHLSEPCGTDNSFSPSETPTPLLSAIPSQSFPWPVLFPFSSLVDIPLASMFTFFNTLCRQSYSCFLLYLYHFYDSNSQIPLPPIPNL